MQKITDAAKKLLREEDDGIWFVSFLDSAMKSFNVTMPEELLAYVRSRTKAGGFGTPTEFMRHLIRKDQEERLERDLEERLVAGLKSGRSRVPAKKFFERMHKLVDQVSEVKRRKAKGRSGKATRSAARG